MTHHRGSIRKLLERVAAGDERVLQPRDRLEQSAAVLSSVEEKPVKIQIWGNRFLELREQGFSDEQLVTIFRLLSDVRAFNYGHIEASAWRQLQLIIEGGDE